MDEEFKIDVEFAICGGRSPFLPFSPLWILHDTLPRFVAHESWNFRLMTEVLLPAIVQSADILETSERTNKSRFVSRVCLSIIFNQLLTVIAVGI